MRSKLIPPLLGYYVVGGGTAAAVPWYLSGGISSANCLAAYQPKGAANLAASYVNLANPGTYNAAPGNAPNWDVTDGWKFNGTDDYLDTGISPSGTNKTTSVLIKYTNLTLGSGNIFGMWLADETSLRIASVNAALMHTYNSGYSGWGHNAEGVSPTSGVLAIADDNLYYNGDEKITYPAGSNLADKTLWIGDCNNSSNPAAIYIQALSIYNVAISVAQVRAVTTAMGAL